MAFSQTPSIITRMAMLNGVRPPFYPRPPSPAASTASPLADAPRDYGPMPRAMQSITARSHAVVTVCVDEDRKKPVIRSIARHAVVDVVRRFNQDHV